MRWRLALAVTVALVLVGCSGLASVSTQRTVSSKWALAHSVVASPPGVYGPGSCVRLANGGVVVVDRREELDLETTGALVVGDVSTGRSNLTLKVRGSWCRPEVVTEEVTGCVYGSRDHFLSRKAAAAEACVASRGMHPGATVGVVLDLGSDATATAYITPYHGHGDYTYDVFIERRACPHMEFHGHIYDYGEASETVRARQALDALGVEFR